MEKIDRELLIKEISTRLPYGVKEQVLGWDEEKGEVKVPLRIYSINTDGYIYFETNDYDVNYLRVDDCLLYLRPMSSMTEEEKDELKSICSLYAIDRDCNEQFGIEILSDYHTAPDEPFNELDWLNKHHFDYRGLIPKGLALEAPKDMYK